MKLLILGFVIVLFLAPGAIAGEESMLVHDLLLAERKVGTTRRVEWSPPPHRRLCCRSEKNYLRQHNYFSRH